MLLSLTLPIIIYLRGGGSISKPYGNFSCSNSKSFSSEIESLRSEIESMKNQEPEPPETVKSPSACPRGYFKIRKLDRKITDQFSPAYGKWRIKTTDYCSKKRIIKSKDWTGPESEYGYDNHPGISREEFKKRFHGQTYGIEINQGEDCPEYYTQSTSVITSHNRPYCARDYRQINTEYDRLYED